MTGKSGSKVKWAKGVLFFWNSRTALLRAAGWRKTMATRMNIMIVDDEKIVRESLFHWFTKIGHYVEKASSGFEALENLEKSPFDVLFVDIKMPAMNGIELLEKVKTEYPQTIVIIITAYGSIESAVRAMQLGASDYLLKPFKPDYLSLVMEKISQQIKLSSEYNYLKGRLEKITRFDDIIGQGPAMEKIFDLIPEVAKSDSSILLTGETGTGKELVAKAIHAKSKRSHFPFIPINCGAIPDSLLESELFGHQKGAFTGANHSRKGFLEVVSGGTLFLDEVGEVSAKMQIDLLRVLEEKKITRIGDCSPLMVDFRLISATRRDLEQEINAGNFREDFFYRINVITIHIPPLRERKEDIPLLIEHFLEKYSQETTKRVDHITRDTIKRLTAYEWPGNVRELENAIERAVVLSRSRTLDLQDFSFLQASPSTPSMPLSLLEMEKHHIQQVLNECDWNITRAAKILDINRVTLHKKIKRLELQRNVQYSF
jgi:DNA-binding NtrC family response regulator